MSEMQQGASVPQWDMADRLRKALRQADMPVQEMADYLGVSRNTIGRYVNGRQTPGLQTLRLWSLRCGVSLVWLRDGASPQHEQGFRTAPTSIPAASKVDVRQDLLGHASPSTTAGYAAYDRTGAADAVAALATPRRLRSVK